MTVKEVAEQINAKYGKEVIIMNAKDKILEDRLSKIEETQKILYNNIEKLFKLVESLMPIR